jgi:hypothetical protein
VNCPFCDGAISLAPGLLGRVQLVHERTSECPVTWRVSEHLDERSALEDWRATLTNTHVRAEMRSKRGRKPVFPGLAESAVIPDPEPPRCRDSEYFSIDVA